MRKLFKCLLFMSVWVVTHASQADTRVVVLPISGASGNATAADVVRDKTFSSSAGEGLTGTRFPAPLRKTGQIVEYNSYDDADYLKGIETSPRWTYAQPNPGGGLIIRKVGYGYRDNNTGLVWYHIASHQETSWAGAISYCENLKTVNSFGAVYLVTNWRLPNVVEMLSLINYGQASPALPVRPADLFADIINNVHYWSSTSFSAPGDFAWGVDFGLGQSYYNLSKSAANAALLCVRD